MFKLLNHLFNWILISCMYMCMLSGQNGLVECFGFSSEEDSRCSSIQSPVKRTTSGKEHYRTIFNNLCWTEIYFFLKFFKLLLASLMISFNLNFTNMQNNLGLGYILKIGLKQYKCFWSLKSKCAVWEYNLFSNINKKIAIIRTVASWNLCKLKVNF